VTGSSEYQRRGLEQHFRVGLQVNFPHAATPVVDPTSVMTRADASHALGYLKGKACPDSPPSLLNRRFDQPTKRLFVLVWASFKLVRAWPSPSKRPWRTVAPVYAEA